VKAAKLKYCCLGFCNYGSHPSPFAEVVFIYLAYVTIGMLLTHYVVIFGKKNYELELLKMLKLNNRF